ncbi:hypothetical protein HDE_03999 [Halotydeus destructor]|nr:hypothetical protein HDE_03999 [Halotydeus destructor]
MIRDSCDDKTSKILDKCQEQKEVNEQRGAWRKVCTEITNKNRYKPMFETLNVNANKQLEDLLKQYESFQKFKIAFDDKKDAKEQKAAVTRLRAQCQFAKIDLNEPPKKTTKVFLVKKGVVIEDPRVYYLPFKWSTMSDKVVAKEARIHHCLYYANKKLQVLPKLMRDIERTHRPH